MPPTHDPANRGDDQRPNGPLRPFNFSFSALDRRQKRRAVLGLMGIALVLVAFFGITIAVVLNYGRALPSEQPEPLISVPGIVSIVAPAL